MKGCQLLHNRHFLQNTRSSRLLSNSCSYFSCLFSEKQFSNSETNLENSCNKENITRADNFHREPTFPCRMFNSLFNSLFGKTKENNLTNCLEENQSDLDVTSNQPRDHSQEFDSDVTAILLDEDKDWLFVERREDVENVDDSNSIDKSRSNLQLVPFKSILSHLGSISENDENTFLSANLPSFYPNSMDDSWFLTPPECFSSVSSIQLESSPLENLLIEHPSMSVYYNFRRGPLNSITNGETIDDLVVIELSQNDEDEDQMEKVNIFENNFAFDQCHQINHLFLIRSRPRIVTRETIRNHESLVLRKTLRSSWWRRTTFRRLLTSVKLPWARPQLNATINATHWDMHLNVQRLSTNRQAAAWWWSRKTKFVHFWSIDFFISSSYKEKN